MPNSDDEPDPPSRTSAALAEVERVIKATQQRALQLFSERGVVEGNAVNKWLAAEREPGWPATEFVEHEAKYVLRIALPGVDPDTLKLTAKARELTVLNRGGDNVTASLHNGVLTIVAPKTGVSTPSPQ